MNLRVLVVTGYYPPPYNANAVRAMYIVKGLVTYGRFDVYVLPLIGTKNDKGFYGEKILKWSKIEDFGDFYQKPSIISRILDIVDKHRKIEEFIKIAKDVLPNVVISTLPPVEAIPLGFEIAKALNAVFVADIQDLADDYRVLEKPWLSPAIRWYFKRVYGAVSKAHLITTTTEFMKEVIVERTGNNNVVLVPNGVDNSLYEHCYVLRLKEDLRDIALFLGDLNFKYHRLDSFIRALAILRREHGVELSLRVIGEGREKSRLLDLVKKLRLEDVVEFLGYVPRDELPLKMYDCLFGIAGRPSIRNAWILNTMRMTIYEYLSCGLPILAYGPPNSYTEHFVHSNRVGVYVASDDPRELSKGVLMLKELIDGKHHEVAKHCREIALKYDWERIACLFIQRIKQLVMKS